MKFNLYGFNQQKAIKLGLSNDDLLILRWFIDFKDSGKMNVKYIEEENKNYYWITYQKIIEDIPILVEEFSYREDGNKEYKESKEKRILNNQKKKLRNMIDGNLSKVLCKRIEKTIVGTFIYLALNEEVYKDIIAKTENEDEKIINDLIECYEEEVVENKWKEDSFSIIQEKKDITMDKKIDVNKDKKENIAMKKKSNKAMIKKSYVAIDKKSQKGKEEKSNIFIDEKKDVCIDEKSNVGIGEFLTVATGEKTLIPLAKKVTPNITLLINNSIKINKDIYSRVVGYLNERCGSNYKSTTKKTKSLINARINDGFKESDFIMVIDKKCEEWIKTEYEKYLRPETLFGTKFEGYLNQKGGKVKNYGGFKQNIKTGKRTEFDFSAINAM